MPKEGSVGYSEATDYKQEKLKALFRLQLKIIKKPMIKMNAIRCFYYFDINAGCGRYEDNKPGSPLIFLQTMTKSNFEWPYRAIFIEKDQDAFNKLSWNVYDFFGGEIPSFIELKHGDHKDILPDYFDNTRKFRMGILYADPNGLFDEDIISEFSKQYCFKKTDIIINCNSIAVKRCRKAWEQKSLIQRLASIDKKNWVISRTFSKWKFSMLIGSDWVNFPVMEKYGFVSIRTDEGRKLIQEINLTKDEIKKNDNKSCSL